MLVGGVPAAVSTVTVGPTVYTQTTCTGTPATSCTSAGTLTQGALTGTFKVPAGVTAGATAVTVIEGNGNPVYAIDPTLNPGNWGGPLPPATSAIDASAVTTYLDTTTASANPSPNSGGTGTTVTVSGSGFDPQQVSCGLSFTVGSDTGTCNVDSSGNLTGSITVGPSETTGITGPTADNIKVAEVGQPNVNLSIPFTLLPLSNTCPISTFAEPNPSPNDTGTTAKALNNNGPAAAQASEVGEPNCTINQIISVNVAGTVLTLSEAQSFTNPAGNPAGTAVSLSNITLGPQDFQNATGNLNTVNVNDARGTLDGWVVTGQMETDFNNATPSGNAVDNVIPADNLTWGPSIALTHGGTIPASNTNTCLDGPSSHTGSCPGPSGAVTGNGAGITGSNGSALNTSTPSEAFAGASANLNNETANGVPMVLCYAPEGGGGGGFLCNATLSLAVPPYVAAGTYSAVMDIVVTGL